MAERDDEWLLSPAMSGHVLNRAEIRTVYAQDKLNILRNLLSPAPM